MLPYSEFLTEKETYKLHLASLSKLRGETQRPAEQIQDFAVQTPVTTAVACQFGFVTNTAA